jgi:hypothetical protein
VTPQIVRNLYSGAAFKIAAEDRVGEPAGDIAVRRMAAYCREEGGVSEGGDQKTTGRGLDKRPQCAAHSVGCFCVMFSTIWQCAASWRNVSHYVSSLQHLCFFYIAEAGNG